MKVKILSLMAIVLVFMGCTVLRNLNPHLYPPTVKERQAYVETAPQLTPAQREAVLNGDIIIGMTRDDVKASRGRATKINGTVAVHGIHEQWIMGPMDPMAARPKKCKQYFYIYFENGIVTSWQNW